MNNVTSLNGSPMPKTEPDENYIEMLEEALERARAGETIGGVLIQSYRDDTCDFQVVGFIRHYSVIGTIEVTKSYIVDMSRGTE